MGETLTDKGVNNENALYRQTCQIFLGLSSP